ncbi:hypothetical protein ABFS82_14G138400 [Erythranthe guttata]
MDISVQGVMSVPQKVKILLGVCGTSVAAHTHKLINLLSPLAEIKVLCTKSAHSFMNKVEMARLKIDIYTEGDEWRGFDKNAEPLYSTLIKWADMMLVAPLSVNMLSKIAIGAADTLMACSVLSCLGTGRAFAIALEGYEGENWTGNKAVEYNLQLLVERGVHYLGENDGSEIFFNRMLVYIREILHIHTPTSCRPATINAEPV